MCEAMPERQACAADAPGGEDAAPRVPSRRIRMLVEYDGTRYAGWQWQGNALTVQQELEDALSKLLGQPRMPIAGASRTDAGVHAAGQVAHVDVCNSIPAEKLAIALNTLLPQDVRVQASQEVSQDFHARFSATGKTYRYQIWNAPHASALNHRYCAHVPTPLDVEAMRAEAEAALGTQDFHAFQATGGKKKGTVRTLNALSFRQEGALITLTVEGNAFLYNMVRILAGTLIDVGRGRIPAGAVARALASGSRLDLGITAPAQGLTLMAVHYAAGGRKRQAANMAEL